jgi:hypothetical protein
MELREATVDEIENLAQAITRVDRYLASEVESIAETLADENDDPDYVGARSKLTPTSLRALARRITELKT